MVDLHVHLLPGVDDGPASLEESVRLGRALVADGIRTAVVTPHVRHADPSAVPAEIGQRVAALARALNHAGIALEVVAGAEVELIWAVEADDHDLVRASIGQRGKDLLVETPYRSLGPVFEGMVVSLLGRGYRVTLAHPERNPTYQADRGRLRELTDHGVLAQATAGSFLRSSRSASAQTARAMLEDGLIHVVSTDAHAATGSRAPAMTAAREAIERLAPGLSTWLCDEVPAAVLAGRAPEGPPPSEPARSVWDRVRGR